MGWNLDDYEPVATRLARWLDDCRTRGVRGRVITELMHRTDDVAVFRAEIYEDDLLIAVGHAEDYRAAKGVNATTGLKTPKPGRSVVPYQTWVSAVPIRHAGRHAKKCRKPPEAPRTRHKARNAPRWAVAPVDPIENRQQPS